MNKILILTDFSKNAWNALFTGLKLYEKSDTLFYILNCFEPKFDSLLGDKSKERLAIIYESLSKNSKSQLSEIERYLSKNHLNKRHRFQTISMGEDILSALESFTAENEIELVVMGTRGATKSRGVFMGSNTVKVIRKFKHCPILAVPEDHDFKSLDRILFPTDFSYAFEPDQLSFLLQMAEQWASQIHLFKVSQELRLTEDQKINKQGMELFFANLNVQYHSTDLKVDMKEAINRGVNITNADMIALIYYSHTIVEKLTREPVVKKMAFNSPVPLLILPE